RDVVGVSTEVVWHRDHELPAVDLVAIPGGFSYGDYLRTGAIAATSPILAAVRRHAEAGGYVLGVCNGFQILCEAGLLPGALIANRDLSFICRFVDLEVVDAGTILTSGIDPGTRIRIPLNSYEGNWVDPSGSGRVIMRYLEDPNGSQDRAAAVASETGNVVGIMPHPERGSDDLLGSADGLLLLESFLGSLVRA
ncbi:MAG: phosphoribosylformylglycinamidine synthase subunit PurQ, partial [Actinobacteria bacterium]|nr:phosphoribosylformylglycinamidine synthase subunit PurQ [Actinomycetota bacterium]